MTSKKIIYYILAAFVTGNILLIYLQYNSSKNINELINGNEKLLGELRVHDELSELDKDINSMENRVRDAIHAHDTADIHEFEEKILEVNEDLDNLQKINDDDSSVKYIDNLDSLVRAKLHFNQQILDTLHLAGRDAAARLRETPQGKKLTEDISFITHKIDSSRQALLEALTDTTDRSGRRARTLGIILIAIVLVSGAILFWFIINRIGQQNQLINELDATEKKVREAAQVKENFMANMSHEIRTPMNAILGFTNLLEKKKFDSESEEYIHAIRKSGENLLAIINDVLDLSKIEAGMLRIESAPFNIRGALYTVESMFKTKAREKGIEFNCIIDNDVPEWLEGDATRMIQILVNLIGNAIKFTEKGKVHVRVYDEGINGNTIQLGMQVEDTGIGIDKEHLSRIFERFHQGEDSITRKYGGTGLGLSIVKDLVMLQHGSIDVLSEAGKGTSFSITIPYRIASDQADASQPQQKTSDRSSFDGVHVLVVEDNEINQSLVRHLFKSWGLSVEFANNGREALAALQGAKYDVILMDIQMPQMDGYTATRIIRNDLHLGTPVIAMTAHALPGEKEKCLNAGMNGYISKPIHEEELYRLMSQFTKLNERNYSQKEEKNDHYRHINLQYMKEVSAGNKEYEKDVTGQFIENIPVDIEALEKSWQNKDFKQLGKIAHNMKTTVSVMGLTGQLEESLEFLENNHANEQQLLEKVEFVKNVCNSALEEARQFYQTIDS